MLALLIAVALAPSPPTNVHVTGQTQTTISIAWSGTTKRYAVWLDGAKVTRLNAKAYTFTGLQCDTTHQLGVRSVTGNNQVSPVVYTTGSTNPCSAGGGTASLACTNKDNCNYTPRTNCTVTPTSEVIPGNTTANHTTGDGNYTWGTEVTSTYWSSWRNAVFNQLTPNFTGTTDELIQHYACKWGLPADYVRAVAVQESDWRQWLVGDYCGTPGQGSYGIIQIKNRYCSGSLAWGGYPDTQNSTPLALDFYGGYLRTCYDGAFYDGGSWLYGGQTVGQIAASRSWDYVMWGCVGSWFSGDWYSSSATSYINSVKNHLANRDWP